MKTVNAVNKNEVEIIHRTLENKFKPIYADIWKIGCNLSLRISDLLNLTFNQIDIDNRAVKLVEKKTGKHKMVRLNQTAIDTIQARRKLNPTDIYLFQSNSHRADVGSAISRVSVSRVFKSAGDILGLDINTHSMRKSRGKAMFDDGVSVAVIAKVLNHSSEAATLRYLGITEEQVLKTYDDYEL